MELKQYPDADKIQWKPEFEERYKKLLGDQYETYKKYSLSFLTRSIRINTLKKSIEENSTAKAT